MCFSLVDPNSYMNVKAKVSTRYFHYHAKCVGVLHAVAPRSQSSLSYNTSSLSGHQA